MSKLNQLYWVVLLAACGDSNLKPDGRQRADAKTRIDGRTPVDASTVDGPVNPGGSASIAAALATPDGTGLDLVVDTVLVTYLKPQIGNPANDPAGFTVQAEQPGPALFIAVDPATLSPAPLVGDTVSFHIQTLGSLASLRVATQINQWTVSTTGADVSSLAQNVSAATDLAATPGVYDSELIRATGTLTGTFVTAGTSFQQIQFATEGVPSDSNLRFRVLTSLVDAFDLAANCVIALQPVPLGRFNSTVQLPAYSQTDFSIVECPAPTIVTAIASSPTSVVLTFSRHIDVGSVTPDGSQFAFDNGLAATAAAVSGRTVTLTTSAQDGATTYTVAVASSVLDTLGAAVVAPGAATFLGFATPAIVRLNELNANIANGCDLIELRVVEGGSLAGMRLQERESATILMLPSISVPTNTILIVHTNSGVTTCNPNAATTETAPAGQPSAQFAGNYDNAFDFWSPDSGLTATDNVFTLYRADGSIMDAVFVADAATGTTAQGTDTQAGVCAGASQWQMVGGGVPVGGFADDTFRAHAALDLNGTGTTASGPSIQRLDNSDDNDKNDWNNGATVVQAQTFGAPNVGQTAF